jgi:hypothetical protein
VFFSWPLGAGIEDHPADENVIGLSHDADPAVLNRLKPSARRAVR